VEVEELEMIGCDLFVTGAELFNLIYKYYHKFLDAILLKHKLMD